MKKVIFSLIFSLSILMNSIVYGSVKTYERTVDNLGISDDIEQTRTVINAALKTPKVDASEKIYDFADLLDEVEEEMLYDDVMDFILEHNMDMAIVTIDDNNKYAAMKYADDFYDYNDFGIGSDHTGVLFLIDMDTREMWISTTGDAIFMYTDARIDNILDECYYYISDEDYYETADAFISEANRYANKGVPSGVEVDIDSGIEFFQVIGVGAFFCFIFSLIFVFINKAKHTTIHKATEAGHYLVKNSFVVTDSKDVFVSTHTNKIYDPPSSSSSGGGRSSTHRSSSGRSHGGGGRRF